MNKLLRHFIHSLLLVLGALSSAVAQTQLRPVDQAVTQPDFFTFRAQLIAAIVRRDVEAVLSVVNTNVKNSFGGNDGIAEFKEMWAIDQPNSRLWEALATVLALGGTFEKDGTFVAPYTFSRWPDGFDSYENVALVGSAVRVRAAPRMGSPALATMSFAILPQVESKESTDQWVSVRLPDGKVGYVGKSFVRSPIDYRAIFEKREGRWQLIVFVSGD